MRELSGPVDSTIPYPQARAVLDHLREVIMVCDPQGGIKFLNAAWTKMSGFSLEETIGRGLSDFVHPEDREISMANLARLIRGEKGEAHFVRRVFIKSGEVRYLDVSIHHAHPTEGITATLVDVTEQTLERERARDTELNLNSLFESSPFPIGMVKLKDGRVTRLVRNAAADLLLKDTADGAQILELWLGKYREARVNGRAVSFDYAHPTANGTLSLRCIVNFVTEDRDGSERFSYVVLDRTAESARERELEFERQQLLYLTANLSDVIWMTNLDHTQMIYISPAFERLFGHSREAVIANPLSFADCIHPEDRDRVLAAILRQGREPYDEIYRIVTLNGEIKWVRDHASVVCDSEGVPQRLVGITSELTEAVLKDQVIKEQNERLDMIINTIPIGIASFDLSGRPEWVNAEWRRMMSHTDPDAIDFDALLPNPEGPSHLGHDPGAEWRDFSFNLPDGRQAVLSLTSVHLSNGTQLRLSKDATSRHEQARLIEEQRSQMAHSARLSALGEMAAGVAHEINNPLAIISGTSQLLRLKAKADVPAATVTQACERISTTVDRIAKIINGLRAMGRDGAGDPLETSNINAIIGDALEMCQTRIRNHQVGLRADIPAHAVLAPCRSVQIAQVLLNLLNNAFDAVIEHSRKEISIVLSETETEVRIQVADSGPGIPDGIHHKVMDPFFTTKPVGKGTGLGLSLSRGIAEMHGGHLTFTTGPDGTTFTLTLPRRRGNPAP